MEISLGQKSGFIVKFKQVKLFIDEQESRIEAGAERLVLPGPGEFEFSGVSVNARKIAGKLVSIYDLEELRVTYLDGLKIKLSEENLNFLDGVDVLLVSGQDEAMIRQIGPSLAISREPVNGISANRREKKLTVNKLSLPEETELVILNG